jgi:hypothetical protein
VNGSVVGRLEQRPEPTLTVENEAAVALEVDQLVQSMNDLLEDHHDVRSDGDERIAAEVVARVEQRPATAMTDSELAGLSLMLESLVDDIADELADDYGRTPYEVLDETGTTVEVTATGTDKWVTRVD